MLSAAVMWCQPSVWKEKVCMTDIKCVSRGLRCIQETQPIPTTDWRWGLGDAGEVCSHNVRQIQYNWTCWWCTTRALCMKQKLLEAIHPTKAALLQHVKRATCEAGYIWSQSTLCQPQSWSPADWGWLQKGNQCQICWTTIFMVVS